MCVEDHCVVTVWGATEGVIHVSTKKCKTADHVVIHGSFCLFINLSNLAFCLCLTLLFLDSPDSINE